MGIRKPSILCLPMGFSRMGVKGGKVMEDLSSRSLSEAP